MQSKNIVILGAGFAGMYSALAIRRELGDTAEITIINKTNHFLFTPMLHEVATGGLGHHQVVESIREIVYKKRINFLEASIEVVDLAGKTVRTSRGEVSYDFLVVALGATTNYFGTPGAAEHSLGLKDLGDAIKMRNRIVAKFEQAASEKDPEKRKQLLSFVVVGGGATGVELAAELAEFAGSTLKKYYTCQFGALRPSVTLVQASHELLTVFDSKIGAYAEKIFARDGITVLLHTRVSEVTEEGVVLGSGEHLRASTIVWAAGVKANVLPVENGELSLDRSGRIVTDKTFQTASQPDVYAIGDIAAVPQKDGTAYPMLAQIAVRQAKLLGKNIARSQRGEKLEAFSYTLEGELVSLGKYKAAGTIMGVHVYGALAWFIWRTVYLFKFISWHKRIKIAVDWTMNLFYSRDVTRA